MRSRLPLSLLIAFTFLILAGLTLPTLSADRPNADLKENQRGRFMKITEDVGGRRDTIMLPAGAFKDFLEALARLVEYESKL